MVLLEAESVSIGVSTGLIIAATCIFLYILQRYASGRTPPGPFSLPIIGNMWAFPFTKPWLAFLDWRDTYGDVMYFHGLGQSIVVLNSKQAIDDLLEKRGNLYSDRPRYTVVGELMGLDRGMPIMQYDDPKRRLQRKLARTALSGDAVRKYHGVQSRVAALMCWAFLSDPGRFRDHARLAAGRIIMAVTYGLPVSGAEHEYITHAEETMEMITQATMPGAFMADIIPILKHLPAWVPFLSPKRHAKKGRAMIERLVETPFNHVVEEMAAGTALPSFTHDLLDDMPNAAEDDGEYKQAVLWAAGSLYGAGGETTYTTVLVFLICMAQHPQIQKKAQEELDSLIGSDRMPAVTDRGKLPYIEAIIKEVMRWKVALPFAIPRRVDRDDVYAGFRIPAGSIVIPNVWAMGMDVPPRYPAEEFVPERFLEDDPPVDPATYAFGFGRRVCPGKLLAENSVFLLITSILYCCNVSLPFTVDEHGEKRRTEMSVEFTTSLVSYPLPFECTIEPRSAGRSEVVKRASASAE